MSNYSFERIGPQAEQIANRRKEKKKKENKDETELTAKKNDDNQTQFYREMEEKEKKNPKKRRERSRDYRIPEFLSELCNIVSLMAANTSRIFVVSVACIKLTARSMSMKEVG